MRLFGWAWAQPTVVLKQFRHLPLSSRSLGGWSAREPGGSRLPWLQFIVEWVAGVAVEQGETDFAVLVLLAFV